MNVLPPKILLDQALRALARGQLQAAEPLLRAVLDREPASPTALAALGQLAAQAGRWAEAEQCLKGSVNSDAAQPRVWYAYAQVLEVQGRPGDAAQAFAQAADRQAGWAAPRYQLARLLRALGRPADALSVADQAAQLAPLDVDTLQLLAMLQEETGHLDAAASTLGRALQHEPRRAALHHNLGVVLHRQGRHVDALKAHERAAALGLDAADAHYNRANVLLALGRIDAASDGYRQALARHPLHALSLYDLARLRWSNGDADFDAELLAARRHDPESDVPDGLRGLLLLKAERPQEALDAYTRAAELSPQNAAHVDGRGQALSRLGRHAEAIEAHRRAAALAPTDAGVLANAARSLYVAGEADQALRMAERAHAAAPHDQLALALLGLGWRLQGDTRAAWLNDLDRLVGVVELPPPPGWTSMEAFNAALTEELGRLHTDTQAPIDQTLRRGTQTRGNLFDLDLPLVRALRKEVEKAVSAWLTGLPVDPAHPMLGRRTAGWRFTDSWSSRLNCRGFHTNHIHSHGWLSSCYYVAAPPSTLTASDRAGWIKFGEPDLPEPVRARLPPQRFEAPRPGRLVLFPSYVWHGTVPFDDDAMRLTVAFDVVPD
jgi:tetratricopeptide (TPR) repeat protein